MNETIGSRIAKYRKQKRMTQEDLANAMGVSSQAVSKWENDASCPDVASLPKLAKLLGVTTDAILSGKEASVILVPPEQRKKMEDLVFRIRINSAQGDRVRVNLPLSLVKVAMEIGTDMSGSLGGMDAVKNIDFSKLIALVEQGVLGKLVEVESADGDTVEIVVE